MVRTEFGLEYLDRPPKERLGLGHTCPGPEAIRRDCCNLLQRWDDPCREPFRRSRSPADRAARPRHTCPGPEAIRRDCCNLQRRDDPCREPFRRSRSPADRAARPRHTCPGLSNGEIVVTLATWMILAESRSRSPAEERLGLVILALVRSNTARLLYLLQRRDDPCREPFRRSRWPAERAARPRHTCPGPEAIRRDCCT